MVASTYQEPESVYDREREKEQKHQATDFDEPAAAIGISKELVSQHQASTLEYHPYFRVPIISTCTINHA